MIIEVNKLLNQTLRITRSLVRSGEYRLTEGVKYAGPVDIDFTLTEKEGDLKIVGRFSTDLSISCDRCLASYEVPLEQEVDLLFIPRDHMPDEIDVELADEDMKIASYRNTIDLSQVIDEQVVLSLPMKNLCSEDCRGLCPRCGKNLNEGDCGCVEERVDERLLVLKEIKEKMFGGAGGGEPNA